MKSTDSSRRQDLYILTHPEFTPVIEARYEALVASNWRDLRPSEGRLSAAQSMEKRSVYIRERDRLRCAKASRKAVYGPGVAQ